MASSNPANEGVGSTDEFCNCGHSFRYHDSDDQTCGTADCDCQAFEAEDPYKEQDRWYPGHPEDQDAYGNGLFDRDHPRLY